MIEVGSRVIRHPWAGTVVHIIDRLAWVCWDTKTTTGGTGFNEHSVVEIEELEEA